MPTTEADTIEARTKAVIRAEALRYGKEERELIAKVIAAEKAGGVEIAPAVAGRDDKIRELARAKLNGHGQRLMPRAPPGGHGLSELRIDLEAVRLIQTVLAREAVEAEAVEAAEWAEKHRGDWVKIVRAYVLKAAELVVIEAQAESFIAEAGAAEAGLPMAARLLNLSGARTLIEAAVDEGIVSAAEIRKAQKGN